MWSTHCTQVLSRRGRGGEDTQSPPPHRRPTIRHRPVITGEQLHHHCDCVTGFPSSWFSMVVMTTSSEASRCWSVPLTPRAFRRSVSMATKSRSPSTSVWECGVLTAARNDSLFRDGSLHWTPHEGSGFKLTNQVSVSIKQIQTDQ